MTDFESKPLRKRVIAPESLVTLPVPAQSCSRNGGSYFTADRLNPSRSSMTNRVVSRSFACGDEYRFLRR